MKKLFPLFFYIPFVLLSCSGKAKNGNQIKGRINNAPAGSMLTMEIIMPGNVQPVDSVKLDKTGEFSFSNPAKQTSFLRLKINNNNFMTLVSDSTETITIEANGTNLSADPKITGSKGSTAYTELNTYLSRSFMRRDSLEKVFQSSQGKVNRDSLMRSLQAQYTNILAEQKQFISDFVTRHAGHLVTLAAVEQLDPEKDYEIFKRVDKDLSAKSPDNPFYKDFHSRVAELGKLAIGSEAPEIIMNNPEGKQIKLSSLKGQVVLLDFWASWCRPCRMENPNVVKTYQANKEKGFTVYSVSLDNNKEAWIKAIKDDKLDWPNHVSELAQWNTSVVKTYNIKGIPQTYLLDREGKIAAKGLRGEELGQKITELLQK